MIPNLSIRSSNESFVLDSSIIGDLWFFEAAARLRGFSAAARELHVTQGAVSQRIRHLEGRLGTKLFVRMGRGVGLTVEGEGLYTVVSRSFRNIEAEAAALIRDQRRNGIVVSCAPSLSMEWLLPRLSSWYRISEHAKIQIRAEFHPVSRDVMLNEGIDVAIRYDRVDYADLYTFELLEERIFPVCTRAYWEANGRFSAVEALRGLVLLHDGSPWVGAEPSIEWRTWFDAMGMTDVEYSRSEYFNLAQMAVRAALLDQGVAMGRSILVADYLNDGRLIRPFGNSAIAGARYRFLTAQPLVSQDVTAYLAQWMKDQLKRSSRSVLNGSR